MPSKTTGRSACGCPSGCAYRGALAALDSVQRDNPGLTFIPWPLIKYRLPYRSTFTRCPRFVAGLTARGLKLAKRGRQYGVGRA